MVIENFLNSLSPLMIFIIKIILAAFLGGLIGLERKQKHYGIGIRTASLIVISATSFTIAGLSFFDTTNIGRIVQGLAAGVGFIGAAIIWRQKLDHQWVRGLTTAVIIWFLTALGILIGAGLFLESIIVWLIVLIILLSKKVGIE